MKFSHRISITVICAQLLGLQIGCASQTPEVAMTGTPGARPAPPDPAQSEARAPANLDQLVAPIALYPDALVAQVLAAATYPQEVVEADRWLIAHGDLKEDALAQAVNQQSWDSSVKGLTQFAPLLAMMDKNLAWTSALGQAYVEQSGSVLDAVQSLRRRAQQAGNLKSSPKESVTDSDGTIVIESATPNVVYLPEYDPWLVYGAPIVLYPDWVWMSGIGIGPGVYFRVGFGLAAGIGFSWGWGHWDADWHRHSVWFNHHPYVSRSPTFSRFAHSPGAPGHFDREGFVTHGMTGVHSGAFSGFDHGGLVHAYSARGQASLGGGFHRGGFHAGNFGGFHGVGGFHVSGGGHR